MAAKNKFMNAMKMPAIADMFSSEAVALQKNKKQIENRTEK